MSFLALVLVLILEQRRPFLEREKFMDLLGRGAATLERHFNAGETHHGAIAWLLAVLPLALMAGVVYWIAYRIHPLLALIVNIGVLYVTMGLRHASHYFTDIQAALAAGELERARALLGNWRGQSAVPLSREEVIRVTIEQALVGAHRHVFGVLFWFVLLPGPIGAVLYRVASLLHERWGVAREPELSRFGWFARNAFEALDWVPARLTAIAFAIVGDFEDAVYSWRMQAALWTDRTLGVVLASGAGALGVRLGNPLRREDGSLDERPELGLGDEPDTPFLDSTVGLIWRALLLWLAMILLITIVRYVAQQV